MLLLTISKYSLYKSNVNMEKETGSEEEILYKLIFPTKVYKIKY